jgi:hypothetical protein
VFLKHVIERKIEGREDVQEDERRYYTALRERENTGISKNTK